ncbi:MAG: cobamide remodeling phosphodiesterase CbiR [Desulfoplanes sp.]
MKTDQPNLPDFKKRFPFRLAVPSYILPNALIPNVRFLGPHVDEIELVLFESVYEGNLPSKADVQTLLALGTDLDLTYNVHLPIDIYLGRKDDILRRKDVETMFRFYERTATLAPTCHVMHLEPAPSDMATTPAAWLEQAEKSLHELNALGMNPAHMAIENMDHPLDLLAPIARPLGFAFCQDLGHLIDHGYNLATHLATYLPHTLMIHLHGIDQTRDHKALTNLSDEIWKTIKTGLAGYTGGLSLEVFSLKDLLQSCPRIQELSLAPRT